MPVPVKPNSESGKPKELTLPKLLIGEGKEESFFLSAFAGALNLPGIQVEEYSGKDKLAAYLKTLVLRPGFSGIASIGITRDADVSAASAFASICSALSQSGLPAPMQVCDHAPGPPRVSVYVMPNGIDTGMLEDLCIASVNSLPKWSCVTDYFDCVRKAANREPKSNVLSKAQLRVWLASQVDPEKLLGTAAAGGYWNWQHPAFEKLTQFLRSL